MGSLNVRGCSTIDSKRCEFGCVFGRREMDVLALCETKMKGKVEVAFGEVTGRVSWVDRGRTREGVLLLLSEWMAVCQKWSKLVAGTSVTMYVGATF